ncbi:cytidylate kinase, putative [Archaeoglobus sulfaticallidus PM70-1]|uniref:Cytidylate kinase n=1 Tax=Archaeoglobus sulfaticallidus PM70-1 TaxID=387631 RepID=N0B939_9EURY|nr:AAA family ATPase [Archaeoglobus sulfaticallidus]AGK60139.1 cytidylate kinase, putative [Archaeoglobus sulfaticallidus PM70-1]
MGVKITISGAPGTGTSTIAKLLSERLNLPVISAGMMFRKLARERGMTLDEFGRYADSNPEIDMLIDRTQKEEAVKRDSCIVEGRLSGWMVEDADLKVLLFAKDDVRFQRIASREKKPFEVARDETLRREQIEMERYLKYYGIDIRDYSIYDVVINSANFGAKEIVEIILTALDQKLNARESNQDKGS